MTTFYLENYVYIQIRKALNKIRVWKVESSMVSLQDIFYHLSLSLVYVFDKSGQKIIEVIAYDLGLKNI